MPEIDGAVIIPRLNYPRRIVSLPQAAIPLRRSVRQLADATTEPNQSKTNKRKQWFRIKPRCQGRARPKSAAVAPNRYFRPNDVAGFGPTGPMPSTKPRRPAGQRESATKTTRTKAGTNGLLDRRLSTNCDSPMSSAATITQASPAWPPRH